MTGLSLARRGSIAASPPAAALTVNRVATATGQMVTGTGVTRTITFNNFNVPAVNKPCLTANVGTSHDGWYLHTAYSAMTVVSSVDGALTKEIGVTGWYGGQPTGSAILFHKLAGLTPGNHSTITVTFTVAGFNATALAAILEVYENVDSIAGATSFGTNTATSVPQLDVAASLRDMAVYAGIFASAPGTLTPASPIYNPNASVAGIGNYFVASELIGEADNSVRFGAANNLHHAHVGMVLKAA